MRAMHLTGWIFLFIFVSLSINAKEWPFKAKYPEPIETSSFIQLHLQFDRGAIHVLKASIEKFDEPTAIPHYTGRFRLEIWSKETLLAVRLFNFPMVKEPSKDETPSQTNSENDPDRQVVAEITASIGYFTEADKLVLVDKRTGKETILPIPQP